MFVRNILQHDFLIGLGRHFTQIKIWNNSEIKKSSFPTTKQTTGGPSNLIGIRTGDRPIVTKAKVRKK
jgi:hypothetical protein